jgi:4-hydroxy-2-oxoheptanedioate aldolase
MIAATGIDFVFLDTEHIVLDRGQLSWMCQAYVGLGVAPVVRIPSPDPYVATQVIDGGAVGVVAPYVESVSQVQALRGATKLRPLKGQRLARLLAGEGHLHPVEQEYLTDTNQGNLCIINVESPAALTALDDILEVPDVDALLIGPHDLTVSLGIPEQYDDKRFLEAVETVIHKGRQAGVGVGIHYSEPDGLEKLSAWIKSGLNFLIHSSDLRLVGQQLAEDLAQLRSVSATGLDEPPRQPDRSVEV